MDDDDFIALIEVLSAELAAVDAADIADERHYVETDSAEGDARLLDPRGRLIEMLQAFDRFLSVRDRALCSRSLVSLNRALEARGPQGVVVEFPQGEGAGVSPVDLAQTPDLSAVRGDLQRLISRIIDPGSDPLPSETTVQ